MKSRCKTGESIVELGRGTRFQKGRSGNPNGRPRTAKFSEAVQQIAAELDPKTKRSGAERLARYAFTRALRGSARHAELFLNYAEGKPKQGLEVSRLDGGPVSYSELTSEQLEARILDTTRKLVADPMCPLGGKLREMVFEEIEKSVTLRHLYAGRINGKGKAAPKGAPEKPAEGKPAALKVAGPAPA